MDANDFINHLQLQPHPEGGYFKESYRATELIPHNALPSRFSGGRNFSTAIFYLLKKGECSLFHRIKSDECWHFYAGQLLLIHVIDSTGKYYCTKLGNKIDSGETLQFVVPAMSWFAAELSEESSFCLAGCTVAPGFDFTDFEMADKPKLLAAYPEYRKVIHRLSR